MNLWPSRVLHEMPYSRLALPDCVQSFEQQLQAHTHTIRSAHNSHSSLWMKSCSIIPREAHVYLGVAIAPPTHPIVCWWDSAYSLTFLVTSVMSEPIETQCLSVDWLSVSEHRSFWLVSMCDVIDVSRRVVAGRPGCSTSDKIQTDLAWFVLSAVYTVVVYKVG